MIFKDTKALAILCLWALAILQRGIGYIPSENF